jgi:NADH pyrophosphatase NudC (nudix superfamily)
MLSIGAIVGVALLGFCAGLFSFRVKSRWCPYCGLTTWPTERGADGVERPRRDGRPGG